LNFYKKIVNIICSAFESIAILSLAAMLVVVMIQIIGRYFFRVTPGWTEEVARQFMILFSFIGIAIGVRDKGHISLTVFVDTVMSLKPKLVVEIFGKVLIVILGIMMSINMGPFFTMLRYNRLPGTGMPVGWRFVFPTAVGVLIALIAIYQIYEHFKYGTDEEQKQMQLAEAAEKAAKESAS
jgi:TRAP-type C4-dicarboxylate transport system permease small subunit